MIRNRALLPADSGPTLAAVGARAAVLSFQLPVRTLPPQSSAAGPGLCLFTADHAGLCLDVSPRHARGGDQCTLAFDRRSAGSGDGGRWIQTSPFEFLSRGLWYNPSIRSSERLLVNY